MLERGISRGGVMDFAFDCAGGFEDWSGRLNHSSWFDGWTGFEGSRTVWVGWNDVSFDRSAGEGVMSGEIGSAARSYKTIRGTRWGRSRVQRKGRGYTRYAHRRS